MASCFQVSVVDALKPVCALLSPEVVVLIRHRKIKEDLMKEMAQLRANKQDMENALRRQEADPQMERTAKVKSWMEEVAALEETVEAFDKSLKNGMTSNGRFGGWCSCWPKYKAGKMARDLAEQVRKLMGERREKIGENLTQMRPVDPVVELPTRTTFIVGGGEIVLSQVRKLLEDDNVGIIGMYGQGGIGKTTLLTALNNEIKETGFGEFDRVIWVTVSSDVNIPKIQKDIGRRLGLTLLGDISNSIYSDQWASTIFAALSQKRFLILLDDVWAKLDLCGVGIPLPDSKNRGKIVMTTRSKEVCIDMKAKMVPVDVLDGEKSWDLFCQNVGEGVDINNKFIKPHAEAMVARCGGLPLTLITVGRAMATKKDPIEWEYAVRWLRNSPSDVRGMTDVLYLLKFSFDRLKDDKLRSCLLYCSLFPEDRKIYVSELVDYLIREDLVGKDEQGVDLRYLRYKARGMIQTLQDACMLGSGSKRNRWVRMHDSIRDMALWLTKRSEGEEDGNDNIDQDHDRQVFVVTKVEEENDTQLAPTMAKWREATRVSVLGCSDRNFITFPDDHHLFPPCNNMSTLFINFAGRSLQLVPGALFHSIPNLRVLELSGTAIEELPSSIGLLVNLRFLGLNNTHINSLPKEIGDLVKLRQLELEHTSLLWGNIPREAITGLSNLQVLKMRGCRHPWGSDDIDHGGSAISEGQSPSLEIADLEGLTQLVELGITVRSPRSLPQLASSSSLALSHARVQLYHSIISDATEISEALRADFGRIRLQRINVSCGGRGRPISSTGGGGGGELRLHGDRFPDLEELFVWGLPKACRLVVVVDKMIEGGSSYGGGGGGGGLFFQSLSDLRLEGVESIEDLNWAGKLPSLKILYLNRCDRLVEILGGGAVAGGGGGAAAAVAASLEKEEEEEDGRGQAEAAAEYYDRDFPKLKYLSLFDLPRLQSIISCRRRRPLLFPSLVEICVSGCPMLTKLPLGTHSAKRLTSFTCERDWWDRLEWDDDGIKAAFAPLDEEEVLLIKSHVFCEYLMRNGQTVFLRSV